MKWRARWDSNPCSPAPEAGALSKLGYGPSNPFQYQTSIGYNNGDFLTCIEKTSSESTYGIEGASPGVHQKRLAHPSFNMVEVSFHLRV